VTARTVTAEARCRMMTRAYHASASTEACTFRQCFAVPPGFARAQEPTREAVTKMLRDGLLPGQRHDTRELGRFAPSPRC
jgi:hypothetical protein